jgi:hypothetical protein
MPVDFSHAKQIIERSIDGFGFSSASPASTSGQRSIFESYYHLTVPFPSDFNIVPISIEFTLSPELEDVNMPDSPFNLLQPHPPRVSHLPVSGLTIQQTIPTNATTQTFLSTLLSTLFVLANANHVLQPHSQQKRRIISTPWQRNRRRTLRERQLKKYFKRRKCLVEDEHSWTLGAGASLCPLVGY